MPCQFCGDIDTIVHDWVMQSNSLEMMCVLEINIWPLNYVHCCLVICLLPKLGTWFCARLWLKVASLWFTSALGEISWLSGMYTCNCAIKISLPSAVYVPSLVGRSISTCSYWKGCKSVFPSKRNSFSRLHANPGPLDASKPQLWHQPPCVEPK